MNRFEGSFGGGGEAKLNYQQNDFEVVRPGSYVVCAVTGNRIPLDDLRYWDAELQEPYATPEIATQRYLDRHSST